MDRSLLAVLAFGLGLAAAFAVLALGADDVAGAALVHGGAQLGALALAWGAS